MAVYDFEERESLEDLKAWWARWGTAVTIAAVIACAIAIGVMALMEIIQRKPLCLGHGAEVE